MMIVTRREEILSTAGDLFREHGYHATSMRDIAKRVEMRGSSLYAHVDSKEDMLLEIVDKAAGAFLAQAKGVDDTLSAKEQLEALIKGHLSTIARELPNATVFFHEWRFLSPEAKAAITEQRDAYERRFRDAVQQGVDEGVFHVRDIKVATLYILSALNWSYQWLNPAGALDLEQLSDHYITLSLNALNYAP